VHEKGFKVKEVRCKGSVRFELSNEALVYAPTIVKCTGTVCSRRGSTVFKNLTVYPNSDQTREMYITCTVEQPSYKIDINDLAALLNNSRNVTFSEIVLFLKEPNLNYICNLETIIQILKSNPQIIIDFIGQQEQLDDVNNAIGNFMQTKNVNKFIDNIIEAGLEEWI
jgi:hypothetical protein